MSRRRTRPPAANKKSVSRPPAINNAKAHETEDQNHNTAADAKNKGDQVVFEAEKNLKEHDDKLDRDDKVKIAAAIGRVKEALKTDNTEEITSATEALLQCWQNASQKMYQQAAQQQSATSSQTPPGATPGNGGKGSSGGATEKPVDADYEVVND
jgi:molecular chaperone DnaK